MDKKEQKLRVLGLLEAGLNPQDISDAEGVKLNTNFLTQRRRMYDNLECHYELLGGIDPVCPGGERTHFPETSVLRTPQPA